MGFFKEFKEDFAEAVNELLPEESVADGEVVNTLDDEDSLQKELDKLDNLFEEPKASDSLFAGSAFTAKEEKKVEPKKEEPKKFEAKKPEPAPAPAQNISFTAATEVVDTEVAVITKGMTINGDIITTGPIEVNGVVNGNINSKGKIVVTGKVVGDSDSKEFFADNATVEGEIRTEGTAKIGLNSVVKGSVAATSAVIAGAVKGDIDVHGPVIVDTTAIVVGNIKSKSVQINNGAIIEGFCSQCYSDIDMNALFGE